jgi:hypothetical protein
MPFDGNANQESWDRARGLPAKLDLQDAGNTPDLNAVVADWSKAIADSGWKGKRNRNDTQFLTCAREATTAILAGMYRKRPRFTPWGQGLYITIRDNIHPGMRELIWKERGANLTEIDEGIYAPNISPDREVQASKKVNRQKFVCIKHKISITQPELWEAELNGYNEFDEKGRDVMEAHMRSINKLIRQGSANNAVSGVLNFPGVRHRIATANWTTGTADDIFDDLKNCIREFVSSDTEEMAPSRLVLGPSQLEQFNTAERVETGKILRRRVEESWAGSGMTILPDPGMKTAGDTGGAAALLYTDDEDLISVSMPLYQWMTQPFQVNATTIEQEIWSMYCGPQIKDTETVMVVEGAGAGW